jgi:hypothetical protein
VRCLKIIAGNHPFAARELLLSLTFFALLILLLGELALNIELVVRDDLWAAEMDHLHRKFVPDFQYDLPGGPVCRVETSALQNHLSSLLLTIWVSSTTSLPKFAL